MRAKLNILAGLIGITMFCAGAVEAGEWTGNCRYRTKIERTRPWRDLKSRALEVSVDFEVLLAKAGATAGFDENSVVLVGLRNDGTAAEMPFALRHEYDPETRKHRPYLTWMAGPEMESYEVYFDTVERGLKARTYDEKSLPPVNLLTNGGFETAHGEAPAQWQTNAPELVRLGSFKHTTEERSLKVVVDDNTPDSAERELVLMSDAADVRIFAGQEMVFECDLLAERARYGAPVSIEVLQFRADGSRILERATDARWTTIELAEGQLVQFRQRGRFNAEAAAVRVCARFRCGVMDADTGEPVRGNDSFFTIWMDRVVVRPGERLPWPAEQHGGFVEGALERAPINRAFAFTGARGLMFNAESEGSLQTGINNPNPRALHWGPVTGTMEFWCRPLWEPQDENTKVFFIGTAWMSDTQCALNRVFTDGGERLEFSIADSDGVMHRVSGNADFSDGKWHHIAAAWDMRQGHIQLFFDGFRVGEMAPEGNAWPHSLFPTGGQRKEPGLGVSMDDTRSVPRQALIGGDPGRAAQAEMDEFRISDVVRYDHDYSPPREEFVTDDATRALFHFENERNGVHGLDDGFVRGHLICEIPPQHETVVLEVRNDDGTVGHIEVALVQVQEIETGDGRRSSQRQAAPADPRFQEYVVRQAERVVQSGGENLVVEVQGDAAPVMQWVTFEHENAEGAQTTLIPHWRANDNVIPFSMESLRTTLTPDAKDDEERTLRAFDYSNAMSYYFIAPFCETFPERHRPRAWYTFLKALNIYPFNECGPLNYTFLKLSLANGVSANSTLGTQHQFQHVFYDGRWRLLDISARAYWLGRDYKTLAGLPDIEEDPYVMVQRRGWIANFLRGEPMEPLFGTAERPHNMDFFLRPGEKAAICWQNEGKWLELWREREPLAIGSNPPLYANGVIVYSPLAGNSPSDLQNMVVEQIAGNTTLRAKDSMRAASLIYRQRCPYTIADASVYGEYETSAAGTIKLFVSFNEGQSWKQAWTNDARGGRLQFTMGQDVMARYSYWLKLECAPGSGATISNLTVRTTFVSSLFSHPGKLSLGTNNITFVGGAPLAPVKTTGRWLERRTSDLGVSFNTVSYPMTAGDPMRNVLVASAAGTRLDVVLHGRAFDGEIAIEGLPQEWLPEGVIRRATKTDGEDKTAASFAIAPSGMQPGEIRGFEVVLREADKERREWVQLLMADSPLVREAEAADQISGAAVTLRRDSSGGSLITFAADGSLDFSFEVDEPGVYALWLRARWPSRWQAQLTAILDDGEARSLHATTLRGATGWENEPDIAYAKGTSSSSGGTLWYRVSGLNLTPGERKLTLKTVQNAEFDALVLLPQTDEMDRSAANLFHNWSFAPWRNPF